MTKWLPKRTEAVVGAYRMEAWQLSNGGFTALVTHMATGAVVAEMGAGAADGKKTLKEAQDWADNCRRERIQPMHR